MYIKIILLKWKEQFKRILKIAFIVLSDYPASVSKKSLFFLMCGAPLYTNLHSLLKFAMSNKTEALYLIFVKPEFTQQLEQPIIVFKLLSASSFQNVCNTIVDICNKLWYFFM